MYIPNLVHITSPEIKVEKELFPFCYYDNFKLAWNPDVDNKNGLVVIVDRITSYNVCYTKLLRMAITIK